MKQVAARPRLCYRSYEIVDDGKQIMAALLTEGRTEHDWLISTSVIIFSISTCCDSVNWSESSTPPKPAPDACAGDQTPARR
jgi:hypothetical protein